MSTLAIPNTPTSIDRQQRRGKWKRAQQVYTNYRQQKLRCDFQETFPNPCSRCAASDPGKPCHVDPSFKSTARRPRGAHPPSTGHLVGATQRNTHNEDTRSPSHDFHTSSTSHDDTSSESPQAPCTTPDINSIIVSSATPRTLGNVVVTGEEITSLFVHFFTYYHPSVPIIFSAWDPDSVHSRCPILFWTICNIGSRPQPDHPLERARQPELCLLIREEVRRMVSALMLDRCNSYYVVQALVLICEFPFVRSRYHDDLSWLYSGLANQIGTQLGMHRPNFAAEFQFRETFKEIEVLERTVTWLYGFVIHQSIASAYGFPSCMSDDWVIRDASLARSVHGAKIAAACPDLPRHLRIARFTLRVASTLGNAPVSEHGAPTNIGPLLNLLATDLAELELELEPLSSYVAIRLLDAKIQLYAFELQDIEATNAEDLLACYTAAVRILELASGMNSVNETRAVFWPRSVTMSFLSATMCLLKLAGVHALAPHKVHVDRGLVLSKISTGYTILQSRSIYPGDAASRLAQCVYVLAQNLNERPSDDSGKPLVGYRARMSLGSLFYEAVHHAVRLKVFATPPPDPFRVMYDAGMLHAPPAELAAPPVQSPKAVDGPQAQVEAQQPMREWTSLPALDGALLESTDWMQGLDAESCEQVMSMAGFGVMGAPWDLSSFLTTFVDAPETAST